MWQIWYSLGVFGDADPAYHDAIIATVPLEVRYTQSLGLTSMEHSWVDAGHIPIAAHSCEVPGGEDRRVFPEFSPGHPTAGSNGFVTDPPTPHPTPPHPTPHPPPTLEHSMSHK